MLRMGVARCAGGVSLRVTPCWRGTSDDCFNTLLEPAVGRQSACRSRERESDAAAIESVRLNVPRSIYIRASYVSYSFVR